MNAINESQEAAFDAALANEGDMARFLANLEADGGPIGESAAAAQKANAAVIEG